MLNYGSSITTSFPNTFCSSPAHLTCQLCNVVLKEGDNTNFYCNNSVLSSPSLSESTSLSNLNKLEKCTHCGVNICYKCLTENQESSSTSSPRHLNGQNNVNKNNENTQGLTKSQTHYQMVKKDFKQMYNYSKDIVEKLHLLNNTIKIEESTISELNLIKHRVNTKAIELIKQINQEKDDLIEQIENVKQKYEEYLFCASLYLKKYFLIFICSLFRTLNERKEYYALSIQYKDELRKVIRKYKE